MIPGSFDYHRPNSLSDAIALLSDHGDAARVIAGGHSLIPMMKLRMADFDHIVDLRAISDLQGITISGDTITIGAMVTQHDLITSNELATAAPIIRETALQIADPQVRYVGTIGGNIANGDPGNDMPGLMQCLDATYHLTGPNGSRTVAARDFYEAAYFTAREDEEILTHVSFKPHARGYAYAKQKRKIGDYATAAAAVLIETSGGTCTAASIALTNLSDVPLYCSTSVDLLVGSSLDDAALKAAVAAAVDITEPTDDNRGPVNFKKHVAGVIIRRALDSAIQRAA